MCGALRVSGNMRILQNVLITLAICGLTALSICWAILFIESDLHPDSDFTRYGWLLPVVLFVWAASSSGNLARLQRVRKISVAQTSSGALGHAGVATSEELRRSPLIGQKGGIRLGYDKHSGEILRYTPRDGHGPDRRSDGLWKEQRLPHGSSDRLSGQRDLHRHEGHALRHHPEAQINPRQRDRSEPL
jgi:hypothetical protein